MFHLIVILAVTGAAFAKPGPYHKRNLSVFNDVGIVGGNETDISKHPWQISLHDSWMPYCGGFLISPDWVVTAAHCITMGSSTNLSIRAGSSVLETDGELIAVSSHIVNPDYDDYLMDKDIALLRLAKSVTTSKAKAAKLPEAGQEIPDNTEITLTGWGATSEGGEPSSVLREVTVPTVNREICAKANIELGEVTENMFCAGIMSTGGKDSCQGDSGGPASMNGVVVGVVSWGNGCARPSYPGVYTQVSKVRAWINENTGI